MDVIGQRRDLTRAHEGIRHPLQRPSCPACCPDQLMQEEGTV